MSRLGTALRVLSGRRISVKDFQQISISDEAGMLAAFPQMFGGINRVESITQASQAYQFSPYVWASLDRIMSAVTLPLIFKRNETLVTGGPAMVLRKPNPEMDWSLFLGQTVGNMEMTGVGYWYSPIETGRSVLWPLSGEHVQPEGSSLPVRFYNVFGRRVSAEQVIAIRRPDPVNFLDGTSSIEAAALAWQHDYSGRKFNATSLQNGATVGGILSNEGMVPAEEAKKMLGQFEARHKGASNAGKIFVASSSTGAKWSFTPATLKPTDLALLGLLKEDKETICGVMGVPPSLVGILEYANYANMDAQIAIFSEFKLQPLWRRIAAIIQEFYLPLWTESSWQGITVEFDQFKSYFLQRIADERLKLHLDAVRAGCESADEWRVMAGLDPLGGEFDIPRVAAPAGLAGVPAGLSLGRGLGVKTFYGRCLPSQSKTADALSKALHGLFPAALPAPVKADSVNGRSPEVRALHWQNFDTKVTEYVEGVKAADGSRKLGSYAKAMTGLLDSLKADLKTHAESQWEKTHALNYDRTATRKAWEQKRLPLISGVWSAGQALAQREIAASRKSYALTQRKFSSRVLTEIQWRATHWSELTEDLTFDAVSALQAQGVAEGWSLQQMMDALQSAADLSPARAERIARTEVIGSLNAGKMDEYQDSGVCTGAEWLATQDDRTREDHAAADGQTVDLGQSFDIGGELLQYPGDPNGSAGEICNCRCSVLPIVATE